MTETQRAAMQQALEFCEELQGGCTDSDDGTVEAITVWCPEVIEALRAALAEPEQRQPLTDDQRGCLVMEHLGPAALTGGTMSVYEAFLAGLARGIGGNDE